MSKQTIKIGNCLDILKTMEDESIDVCVTSPPYWALRDYGSEPVTWPDGWTGQLGLEPTFNDYIEHLIMIFNEVYRVLKPTGACWVNLGDTYNGNKKGNTDLKQEKVESGCLNKRASADVPNKSLCQIPSRFAIAMTDAGWCLRNKIIWHKPNVMPQSCTDRFTIDFEEFFFFTKNPNYYFKQQFEAFKGKEQKYNGYSNKSNDITTGGHLGNMTTSHPNKDGRNMRTVWSIPTQASSYEHIAMFPDSLISIPIDSCCPSNGIVLDPFCGSGTVLEYCRNNNINAIGIEINPKYKEIIKKRSKSDICSLDIGD